MDKVKRINSEALGEFWHEIVWLAAPLGAIIKLEREKRIYEAYNDATRRQTTSTVVPQVRVLGIPLLL
jgi:hypothetical protein